MGFGREDIRLLSRNAFEPSFLTPEDKRKHRAEIDAYAEAVG